ncbi:MAG: substrate-binding domain-containing protein [Candidatus Brocadiia bacterium]
MSKALKLALAAALAAGLACGCGTRSEKTIAISVLTMTNPFFKEIAEAVEEEAARHGFGVIVTSAEMDAAKQRSQVQEFIAKGVSAIILTPADSKAVGTAIKEANEAGIPVFTCDIASLAEDAEVVSHIATDNYQGGRLAAQAMMEALEGVDQPRVAIIDHPEVESVILRTRGFRDELEAQGSSIHIVGAWPGKGAKDTAFSAAQDILSSNEDLDGIFAINDPSALGACAALEKAEGFDDVAVVGFDGQPEGKQAIKEGRIYADPIQFPRRIGRTTVRTIVRYLDGEEVEEEILIPTALYKKADALEDPALKDH